MKNKNLTRRPNDFSISHMSSYCNEFDIVLDLKWILSDYYNALFQEDGKSLMIRFNNGQSFLISVSQK